MKCFFSPRAAIAAIILPRNPPVSNTARPCTITRRETADSLSKVESLLGGLCHDRSAILEVVDLERMPQATPLAFKPADFLLHLRVPISTNELRKSDYDRHSALLAPKHSE